VGATIVVGVDGSEGSLRALRWAADEAKLRDATLHVVTAWQYPVFSTMPAFGVLPPTEEMSKGAEDALRQLLAEEGLTGRDDITVLESVVQGSSAAALLEAAADAELLVLGSRGHGGFKGLLLGSVSQAVVAHSPCPVVVIPSANDEPPARAVEDSG
jgi:nucleotide-binding universal stress UspA family protein